MPRPDTQPVGMPSTAAAQQPEHTSFTHTRIHHHHCSQSGYSIRNVTHDLITHTTASFAPKLGRLPDVLPISTASPPPTELYLQRTTAFCDLLQLSIAATQLPQCRLYYPTKTNRLSSAPYPRRQTRSMPSPSPGSTLPTPIGIDGLILGSKAQLCWQMIWWEIHYGLSL
jgi:hypothetical protein